ncbi:MAG: hypothetical protein ACTSQJ_19365 [Promethearchaeota archaeon]
MLLLFSLDLIYSDNLKVISPYPLLNEAKKYSTVIVQTEGIDDHKYSISLHGYLSGLARTCEKFSKP